jgi:hypothetical protein
MGWNFKTSKKTPNSCIAVAAGDGCHLPFFSKSQRMTIILLHENNAHRTEKSKLHPEARYII